MLDEAPTHHGLAARSARRDQAGAAHNACRADHLHPGASLGTAARLLGRAHIGHRHAGERRRLAEGGPRPDARHRRRRNLGRERDARDPPSRHADARPDLGSSPHALGLVAALKPNYRVAPVTAIIVLLSTTGVQLGPPRYAIDRVSEIG